MQATITVLGSGTSHGVPMIGCSCAVCTSTDPHDRRTRPSIYVDVEDGPKILIDASTDLRTQALRHKLPRVDAILFTHSHADHIMGLDDVRRFNQMQKATIPAYADARTCEALRRTFFYIFDPNTEQGGGLPKISLTEITQPFAIGAVAITPVPLLHGARPILGFRIGNFAYLTDTNRIPDESWPLIAHVDTMILDGLRHRPHPTHFTVAEALAVVERARPQQTYLTHICHDLPHVETNRALPAGVQLAYDGLVVRIDTDEVPPKRPEVA